MELNRIYNEPNLETMARMPDGFIDLTVTSPPYDDLRNYNGYQFKFEAIADSLFRVTKYGGAVVWIVNDATRHGSETGSSFKQALYFKSIGFNLWDTMIWQKSNPMPTDSRIPRYLQAFEYMFVFSKGKPTCNHIRVACINNGAIPHNNYPARRENGNKSTERIVSKTVATKEDRVKENIWKFAVHDAHDEVVRDHPATFPEALARDHILSWSNENDLIYDPFMGSGTTAKAAHQLKRRWIGSEISAEYVALASKRLEPYLMQTQLF